MYVLLLVVGLVACRSAVSPPPQAEAPPPSAAIPEPPPAPPRGAPTGPLAGVALPAKWSRLAFLDGAWVTPPEEGSLPPLEIDRSRAPPVLVVRSGAGASEHAIMGAKIRGKSTTLLLEEGEATFQPYAPGAAGSAAPPPAGAWAVSLPNRPSAPDVAWYAAD